MFSTIQSALGPNPPFAGSVIRLEGEKCVCAFSILSFKKICAHNAGKGLCCIEIGMVTMIIKFQWSQIRKGSI